MPSTSIDFVAIVPRPDLSPLPGLPSTSAAAGARLEATGGWRIKDTFVPGRVHCVAVLPTGPRGSRPGYRIELEPEGGDTSLLEGPSKTQVALDFFVDSGTTTLTPRVQMEWQWRGDYFDSFADNPRPSLPPAQDNEIRAQLSQDRRRAAVTFVSYSKSADVYHIAWYRASLTVVCPQPMPLITL